MAKIPIKDLTWGLNLREPSLLKDNEFVTITNMSYNSDWRLQSRRGIQTFWNPIGSGVPITSTFYFHDRVNDIRVLIAASGTNLYRYTEWTWNWASIQSGLTEFEADGITRTKWSFAVLREKIYLCNWLDDYAEYDPNTSTYTALPAQPKPRYVAYLADAIYATWVDAAPWLLYVTNAIGATAADGRTIDANDLLVGWWESGAINALEEMQEGVLAYKDKKVFYIDGALTSAKALDAENGWYGNRAVQRVWNSVIYFNDRWFTTLKAKNASVWANSLQDSALSDNVRKLTALVTPKQYNATIGAYILPLTNYYGSFDTSWDDIADTTLVYSALTKTWTKHILPGHYDFGTYKDDDGIIHYLMASATSDQMLEMEVGFTDLGVEIPCELETKPFDLGDPNDLKTVYNVDISWLKSEGDDITVDLISEGQSIWGWVITDDYINATSSVLTVWTRTIGSLPIWWGAIWEDTLDLYKYFIRLPIYHMGQDISINMSSNSKSLVWTLDRPTLYVDGESDDLVYEANIG